MGQASIPVDLRNPGQVFACLGFLEAAEVLCGPAEGGFDWTSDERFILRAESAENPIEAVLDFLFRAKSCAVAPSGSPLRAKEAGVETLHSDRSYPAPEPETPSALPARLIADRSCLRVEHWADGCRERDNVKLWAGMGGYSGAALVRDLLAQVARWSSEEKARAAADPFAAAAPQSSSLRFEVRSSYVPLELGFSLNEHSEMRVQGYPLVDLLAAIGLQNARPAKSNKLQYRYSVSAELLPVQLARAALGGHDLRFPYRVFVMQLGWPGKEGQARCILFAEEKSAYE